MATPINQPYFHANPAYKQTTPYIPPAYFNPADLPQLNDSFSQNTRKFDRPVNPIQQAATIVKPYEGFRAKAYTDSAGHLTVGYGQRTENPNAVTTEAAASQWMFDRLGKNHQKLLLNNVAYREANPNQQGAMLDFSYNVGTNWSKYTDLSAYSKDPKGAPYIIQLLPAFRKDDKGVEQEGLTRRRADEVRLGTSRDTENYFPIHLK